MEQLTWTTARTLTLEPIPGADRREKCPPKEQLAEHHEHPRVSAPRVMGFGRGQECGPDIEERDPEVI